MCSLFCSPINSHLSIFSFIKFDINDRLPNYFCTKCITRLNGAYQFRQQCETTQEKLLKSLAIELDSNGTDGYQLSGLLMKHDYNGTAIKEEPTEYEVKTELTDATSWTVQCLGQLSEASAVDQRQETITEYSNEEPMDTIEIGDDESGTEAEHDEDPPSDRPFICFLCEKSFFAKNGLQLHMRTHIGDKPFTCSYCDASFPDKHIFEKHLTKKHSDQNPFSCVRCDASFPCKPLLVSHEKVKHTVGNKPNPFGCDQCTLTFSNKDQLAAHCSEHAAADRSFRCFICATSFVNREVLQMHLSQHSDTNGRAVGNRKLFKCNRCDSVFLCKSSLVTHKESHPVVKPFKCLTCDASFAVKGALMAHCDRKKHAGTQPFLCMICKKSFEKKQNLQIHLMEHTGERLIECNKCEATFMNEMLFRKHKAKVHPSDRPYKCSQCVQSFVHKIYLIGHMKTHSSEEFYKCGQCDGTFSSRNNLLKHRKAH